jgi:DNA repair exonuclease SbcCD nuclease subunit
MKIGIIGDLHFKDSLGYADYISDRREKEKKEILDFIVEKLNDCDEIVMLGDQLNGRNNSSRVLKEFVAFLTRFGNKQIFILGGNHEKLADGTSALDFLRETPLPNWHIITTSTENNLTGIHYCPYFTKPELGVNNNLEGQKLIMKKLTGGDILFVHHAISDTDTISGINTNLFDEIVLPKKELEKRYKLIIGGHIHKPQQKGQTIITGSIFNNEVGEQDKMLWKIDRETLVVEKINLPGRIITKLENPTDSDLKQIQSGSIVKIVLKDPELKTSVETIKKKVKAAVGADGAYLFLEQYPNERKKIHFEEGMVDFSVINLLQVYAKTKKIDHKKLTYAFELINRM